VQVSGVRGATVRLGLATVRLALAPRRFRASISKLAALLWLGNNRAGEFGMAARKPDEAGGEVGLPARR
jgi:hypothetical protein